MVCAGFSVNMESHIYKEKGKGKRNAQNNSLSEYGNSFKICRRSYHRIWI